MKKEKIQENLHRYINLDNSFDGIRSELDRVEKENPKHFDFEIDLDYGIYDGDGLDVIVSAHRWETDREKETRKKRSARAKIAAKKAAATKKANREKKDLETYKKLKKKYGGE